MFGGDSWLIWWCAAFEESASSTVDKDVYTKAEVEHIKQGIADEVSRYCVPTCSAKVFGQMMREVEAIMQQTQARNKEMESELQAMQRSYEVTDCSHC